MNKTELLNFVALYNLPSLRINTDQVGNFNQYAEKESGAWTYILFKTYQEDGQWIIEVPSSSYSIECNYPEWEAILKFKTIRNLFLFFLSEEELFKVWGEVKWQDVRCGC